MKDRRWLFWRWKHVSNDTYITRLDVIRTPWFEIKLHWMHGPDPERAPHDHPWPFFSLVLRGGYVEKRWFHTVDGLVVQTLRHRWFNWMPDPLVPHRIIEVEPKTLTLLLTLGRRREWGFRFEDGTWVPWHEYKGA